MCLSEAVSPKREYSPRQAEAEAVEAAADTEAEHNLTSLNT